MSDKKNHIVPRHGEKKAGGRHLVSDETIMKKYGISQDADKENDTDQGGGSPPPPKGDAGKKRRRRTLIVIGIITLVAIGVILWLAIPNSGNSHYDNNMSGIVEEVMENKDGFPKSISGTSVDTGNFAVLEEDLIYTSDTSIVRLNHKGTAVYERNHSFYHPITKTNGEYVMTYNVSSTGWRIDNKKETVRSEESDNVLMAADVAANGRYALVTEVKGYPSQLAVYLEDGTLQYRYSFSNCYVVDVSLNDDGTRAAVIGVTANEGALVSEVYLFDFSSETPLTISSCENTLLMAVEYCDGRALAVGDNKVVSVNESGEKNEYDYGNRKLSAYDYNGSRLLVGLAPYDSASSNQLVVLSSKAEEFALQPCTGTMLDVSLRGDTMAVLADEQVSSYSVNAARNFRGDSEDDAPEAFNVTPASNDTNAIALANESAVYLLGISEVQYVDY